MIRDLNHKEMNRVFGVSFRVELQYLLTVGYITTDKSFLTTIKRIQNLLLRDLSWQTTYFKATAKGLALINGFMQKLEHDRKSTHKILTSVLSEGEIDKAISIARRYYYGNRPLTPAIWGVDAQPTASTILVTKALVNYVSNAPHFISLDPGDYEIIRLQAMERLLTGTVLVDRMSELHNNLHENGNAWLVNQLCVEAQTQALRTQQYQEKAVVHDNRSIQPVAHIDTYIHNATRPEFESGMLLPKVKTTIRFKITIPYIILATIICIMGAYILSQALLDSIEQRFFNQLIETGKLSADRMVIEENRLLETLRLVANTEGVPKSIENSDAEELRRLILPLAVNAKQLAVVVLDVNGESILSMRRDADAPIEEYEYSRGDTIFATWDIVMPVINRIVDESGRDKHAGFVEAEWGDYFFTSGPIITDNGNLVGVVLVGKPIDVLVTEFREDTLAHITFYDQQGKLIATSLLADELATDLNIDTQMVSNVIMSQDEQSVTRGTRVASITYRELLGPWEARNGSDLGIIGTSLPESFLVNPSNTTRFQIFGLLLLGLAIIIAIGIYVARRITQPLKSVVEATQEVAQGHLNVSVQPQGHDEVALLAHAFNHMVTGLKEVTERRFREIELVQQIEKERDLRELKSRFVSMVSHEFRTPLATILSSSDYVRKYGHKVPDEKKEKHFNRIEQAVQNMTALLEDVLLIGRTEAGRLEFNPELSDFIGFCQNIAEEMQINASIAHHIVFDANQTHIEMVFDSRLMRLVLTNLLSNALKYSPNGGEVVFSLTVHDRHVCIQVKDPGIGIPQLDLERLFIPFSRAGNVGSISGTGLGLYIVKMVIELHNGNVEVESVVGNGTTFILNIPIKTSIEDAI